MALVISNAPIASSTVAQTIEEKPRFRILTSECILGSSGLRLLNYLQFGTVAITRRGGRAVSMKITMPSWHSEMRDPTAVLLLRMAAQQIITGTGFDASAIAIAPDQAEADREAAVTAKAISAISEVLIALESGQRRRVNVVVGRYSQEYLQKCSTDRISDAQRQ